MLWVVLGKVNWLVSPRGKRVAEEPLANTGTCGNHGTPRIGFTMLLPLTLLLHCYEDPTISNKMWFIGTLRGNGSVAMVIAKSDLTD
jgi:hypothetical protein